MFLGQFALAVTLYSIAGTSMFKAAFVEKKEGNDEKSGENLKIKVIQCSNSLFERALQKVREGAYYEKGRKLSIKGSGISLLLPQLKEKILDQLEIGYRNLKTTCNFWKFWLIYMKNVFFIKWVLLSLNILI